MQKAAQGSDLPEPNPKRFTSAVVPGIFRERHTRGRCVRQSAGAERATRIAELGGRRRCTISDIARRDARKRNGLRTVARTRITN